MYHLLKLYDKKNVNKSIDALSANASFTKIKGEKLRKKNRRDSTPLKLLSTQQRYDYKQDTDPLQISHCPKWMSPSLDHG